MPSDPKPPGEEETQPGADTPGTDQENEHSSEQPDSLADTYDLKGIISGLVSDLNQLRAGKISVPQARASAELARQALRGLHFVVTAQRMLMGAAKQLPNPDQAEAPAKPPGRKTQVVTIDA